MKSRLKNIRRKGFSLIEVLIAIAILGVGLVMVATIFPVAATWTRQAAEETVASQVALNAVNIIKVKLSTNAFSWQNNMTYPAGSLSIYNGRIYKANVDIASGGAAPPSNSSWVWLNSSSATTIPTLCDYATPYANAWNGGNTYAVGDKVVYGGHAYTALLAQSSPGNTPAVGGTAFWTDNGAYSAQPLFSIAERAYAFGSDSPYPAAAPANATYFWTAVLRPTGIGTEVNVYVCVFRKGSADQQFTSFGGTEVAGSRGSGENLVPAMIYIQYNAGTLNASTNTVVGAVPPVGAYGIGMASGTVFRQGLNADASLAAPTVTLSSATENIVYAPAPDNSDPNASPLVYIYQTKLSF